MLKNLFVFSFVLISLFLGLFGIDSALGYSGQDYTRASVISFVDCSSGCTILDRIDTVGGNYVVTNVAFSISSYNSLIEDTISLKCYDYFNPLSAQDNYLFTIQYQSLAPESFQFTDLNVDCSGVSIGQGDLLLYGLFDEAEVTIMVSYHLKESEIMPTVIYSPSDVLFQGIVLFLLTFAVLAYYFKRRV